MESRIDYKVACICYSAKYENGPDYLKSLLITYENPSDYNLRSRSDNRKLCAVDTNLVTIGDRSFAKAAATVWNSLPYAIRHSDNITTFKQLLKTYLFCKAFD